MPLIELHPAVAKNLLNYLVNARKRAEFVIKKSDRYDAAAVQRAKHVVSLLTPVINALKNPVGVTGKDAGEAVEGEAKAEAVDRLKSIEDRITALENRVKSWEAWKENTNVVLRRLVSYHEGDLK